MYAAPLFTALSQAIFDSLAYGLTIYILVKVALFIFRDLSSSWRYNLLYSCMVLIFASFIISVFRHYNSTPAIAVILPETALANQLKVSAFSWNQIAIPYSLWVGWAYIAGLVSQAIFLLIAFHRLNINKLRNSSPATSYWNERLESLKVKLEISKSVRLHVSEKILVPFTAGFLKPVILFPVATINQLTIDQVEAVLIHELAHIKRHDYLVNILQRVMEIALFFNPIIWLLSKEIRLERENCCDDLVLEHTGNPNDYARALALIEEYRLDTNGLAMAIAGSKKYNLLNRIKNITNMKAQTQNSKQRLFALLSIIAISLSLAWMIPADTTKHRASKNNLQTKVQKLKAVPSIPPIPPAPPAPVPAAPSLDTIQPPKAPAPPRFDPSDAPVPPAPIDTNKLKSFFNSPEWKKQMEEMKIAGEEMKKHFNSPEWKKQIEEMKISGEEMKKQFNSPEWKKQLEEMKISGEEMKKQFNSPEWKKQMENMKIETEQLKKQFNSPEWKKQMESMKIETEQLKKQFNSPEWKKQMENMKIETEQLKKQFDSPEWKKQMEDMKVETEKMKKQFESPEWKKKMKELQMKEEVKDATLN